MSRPHRKTRKPVVASHEVRIPQSKVLAGTYEGRGIAGTAETSTGGAPGTDVTDPAALTADSTALAALTFSSPPTQAECNALRDELVTQLDNVIADMTELRTKLMDNIDLSNAVNAVAPTYLTGVTIDNQPVIP